jgi:peptidoglycan hydrolase CwlO-like protein
MANSNNVTFRWLANTLFALVTAMVMTGLGWVKATQDSISSRVEAAFENLRALQSSQSEINYRVSNLEAQNVHAQTERDQLDDRFEKLQRQVDIENDWIQAQIYADKAHRELR